MEDRGALHFESRCTGVYDRLIHVRAVMDSNPELLEICSVEALDGRPRRVTCRESVYERLIHVRAVVDSNPEPLEVCSVDQLDGATSRTTQAQRPYR